MRIIWVGNTDQKEELLAQGQNGDMELIGLKELNLTTEIKNIDACIDLLFDDSEERLKSLQQLQASVIIINSVINPLPRSIPNFVRINGWATFLKRPFMEATCNNNDSRIKAERVFSSLNKKIEWVPDIAGLISPRVIASIINEAFFTLEEGVSTKKEIDTAMRLGTNYPFGPFEWMEKIGAKNILKLLNRLSKDQKRYQPSALLIKEASN